MMASGLDRLQTSAEVRIVFDFFRLHDRQARLLGQRF